eukprot:scaffold47752_cov66-Phaeocystis_antarctica.AAC.2
MTVQPALAVAERVETAVDRDTQTWPNLALSHKRLVWKRAQNGAVGSSRTLMRPGRREHSHASTIDHGVERERGSRASLL